MPTPCYCKHSVDRKYAARVVVGDDEEGNIVMGSSEHTQSSSGSEYSPRDLPLPQVAPSFITLTSR